VWREKYLFLLITLLNLAPLFAGKFFPTMDGVTHLYNSNLIIELLRDNDQIGQFFAFNAIPVPNWTGHIILSILNSILPAFIAEKGLLILYLLGLPYAFRELIKAVNKDNIYMGYCIFPFTYSFLFLLGFYNFSIALSILLFAISFWIKHENFPITTKSALFFCGLLALTFFSHILVFALLVALLGLKVVFYLINEKLLSIQTSPTITQSSWVKMSMLLITCSLGLLLYLYFFYPWENDGTYSFVERSELLTWLLNLRPIIVYDALNEQAYTRKIFYILAGLGALAAYSRIRAFKNNSLLESADFWLASVVFILALYLIAPDSVESAGFISVRLALVFFLTLIVWYSTQKIPKWIGLPAVGVILLLSFSLNRYYTEVIASLDQIALSCIDVSNHIEPNSVVLPIDYSDNWLTPHFSNYLGVEKPLIILENYECGHGSFPLIWNDEDVPNMLLGNIDSTQLVYQMWTRYNDNPSVAPDYVFVLHNSDTLSTTFSQTVKDEILKEYSLSYSNEHCKLYRRKG